MKIAQLVPAPRVHREPPGVVSMRDEHKATLANIAAEAAAIAGIASRIGLAAHEIMRDGGTISMQAQINYLTGALMRLNKDWAIVERLQGRGSIVRRDNPTSKR